MELGEATVCADVPYKIAFVVEGGIAEVCSGYFVNEPISEVVLDQ
jgi:hypothetical protein